MFDSISFESIRLRTKRLTAKDAQTLFNIYSDAEAMKYRGSKAMTTIDDAYEMVDQQYFNDGNFSKLRLGIVTKSDNTLIGTLLLQLDQKLNGECEVGFSFGKNYWGNGYGKETLYMVEQEITSHIDIKVINAWCVRDNLASINIFKKSGFIEIQQGEYPKSMLFEKKVQSK